MLTYLPPPFLLLFLSTTFLGLKAQEGTEETRMDWEVYDPPNTLVVPEHPTTRAKMPFIDIHSHHWRMVDQDLDKLIREMDSLNMFGIVNLSGQGGRALKAITDNINGYGYEDRIFVFTNINMQSIDEPDWAEETVKQIRFDVQNGAKGLKIYKSQGMINTDRAGNRIKINDPQIDPVWAVCGELNIPVLIHAADPKLFWEPHDENNECWLELKLRPRRKRRPDNPAPSWETIIGEAHDVFRKYPETKFKNAATLLNLEEIPK